MPTKSHSNGTIKLPLSLSIKDIITIVSVAVSITLAWGVFSTRIAVLEKEVLTLQAESKSRVAEMERVYARLRRLEAHQQDDEMLIDQVFYIQKRTPPPRHAEK